MRDRSSQLYRTCLTTILFPVRIGQQLLLRGQEEQLDHKKPRKHRNLLARAAEPGRSDYERSSSPPCSLGGYEILWSKGEGKCKKATSCVHKIGDREEQYPSRKMHTLSMSDGFIGLQ